MRGGQSVRKHAVRGKEKIERSAILNLCEEIPARAIGDCKRHSGFLFVLRGQFRQNELQIGSSGDAEGLRISGNGKREQKEQREKRPFQKGVATKTGRIGMFRRHGIRRGGSSLRWI